MDVIYSENQKEMGTVLSYVRITGLRINTCNILKIPFCFKVIEKLFGRDMVARKAEAKDHTS